MLQNEILKAALACRNKVNSPKHIGFKQGADWVLREIIPEELLNNENVSLKELKDIFNKGFSESSKSE